MSLRRLTTILALAFLPLFTQAQAPQNMRDRDPDLEGTRKLHEDLQQANFHAGSWYLWSRLRLSDAGFTDSGYVPTGGSSSLSLSVEAPQRLFYVPHKKVIFTLDAIPGYSFFNSDDADGQINYLVRGDAHFLWNHLYLDVYGLRSDRLRAHVADINRLATTREDEVGAAGEVKYSSRTSGTFILRKRRTSYPEGRYQPDLPVDPVTGFHAINLLDRDENNARISVNHKTFPLTSLFAAAEVSEYDFDNASYKNSRRTWAGAGFLYDSGRATIRLEGGPLSLDFDDSSQRSFSGFGASFDVARQNGRWVYTAGANRDLGFSIFADNNYYISTSARVGVEHATTRRLTLRANALWEQDDYEEEVAGNLRRDEIFFTSVGFSYGIRRLRSGVDVGWYDRQSTYGGDIDSGIRYVLHLSFEP